MKGINKINIYHKLTAVLLASSVAFSLTGCAGRVDMKKLSPSALLEIQDVKDVTLVDELLEKEELSYNDDLNIIEAAEKLEKSLDILEDLKDIDFKDVSRLDSLTEEQKASALSLTKEDIELLKEDATYNGKDLVEFERKLFALKTLYHLKETTKDWVEYNGRDISIEYMMAAVKGSVADELGLSTKDYSKITIPAKFYSKEPEDYVIHVGDDIYRVPVGVGEIWNTIDYIYAVQEATLKGDKELETYRKALNYGKTTMAAGSNHKKNKLSEQYSASYIEKNYVK